MVYHKRSWIVPLALVAVLVGYASFVVHTAATAPMSPNTAPEQPKPFTIVALPDTQYYSESYPNLFLKQTTWIADNLEAKNIVYVTHEGDVVNVWNDVRQWDAASTAMAVLDPVVPYGIAPGNHDQSPEGAADFFETYFPMSRVGKVQPSSLPLSPYSSTFGSFENRNNYRLFEAADRKFIAFNLDFCPTDAALDWANKVLDTYDYRQAIITTHSFINSKGERESRARSCDVFNSKGKNAPADIWQKLVVGPKRGNILLFLSGHDIWSHAGAAHRTDMVRGKPVHQLLADYQEQNAGGGAYLRLLEFDYARHSLRVKTYSPWFDLYLQDPDNEFELALP